ncbi:DNA polymerase ligase N-terminal domain-containing protein [Brevibacterium marinum]|uniref:DNA ligase D-like protein (Predicted 3'-phosphoesterase) n=1 Tax=Brevibacterium marinum TaxID=418643 RepID=A0A846S9U4_9MICO|nr:DNA polymerase ligase N-terminal domain-containing protein [Brevibacterium marinum]NJC58082.1 DNA ligase D-like protein (predicted 3'-phosphoesterase) [Brevibacterium marinum]
MAEHDLKEYRDKRRNSTTSEPSGETSTSAEGVGAVTPVFVIHRHDATNLHFDFRLEIDGVLVSWAVPKGPSLDPSTKRLAHRTEDHPYDYADFEGRIEEGYGAGTVIVWDTGTFENATEIDGDEVSASQGLDNGHLVVVLHGQKLAGAFALTQTKMNGDEANWLLVKVDDSGADRRRRPTSTQNESVLSGRRNQDIAADEH